jgi:hypothetical protein
MPELQTRGCRVITLVIFSPALIPTPLDLVKQPEDNIRVGFSKMAFVLQTQKCQVVYGNNANGGVDFEMLHVTGEKQTTTIFFYQACYGRASYQT